jgi:hypothetical protein
MPEDFPRPSEIYEGSVCVATGNQATSGYESRDELLVEGSGPYLPCDQLSAEQQAELNVALDDIRTNSRFTNGGIDKIRRYEQAASGGGDYVTKYDSDSDEYSDDDFSDDEEPPIEPLE